MEFGLVELMIPAVVTALVALVRQFTEKLDGPKAYWVSVAVNVVAQVAAQVQAGGDPMAGAALGLGTGAVVGPGLASTGKRVGLAKFFKPRSDS